MSTITLAYPLASPHAEAHIEGCKAATRKSNGWPTRTTEGFSVEDIKSMQANPDEGHIKVHACAKEALAASTICFETGKPADCLCDPVTGNRCVDC